MLLILTYSAICVVIFKIFKLPLNKWTVPTAVLGGVILIGTLIMLMNYNHPYSEKARKYAFTTPIIPAVRGLVLTVDATPNELLEKGEVLFTLDPTPYQAAVDSLTAQLKSAKLDLGRAQQLLRRNAGTRRDRDLAQARYDDLRNQLIAARYNLNETVVRAPTGGYVSQVFLRPGMMAVNIPLRPSMVFVHQEANAYVGWFRQNSLLRLEKGDEAEIAFDGIPGKVFYGEVDIILPILAEGQLQPSGTLATDAADPGRIPVHIRITDPSFDQYRHQLPAGAYGQMALYSDHVHHVAIMRKILLRMSAWMNYVFPFH
ncbi:HlyD family secretion protein [Nitrococcus mobilis]|uniref:Secretion protein, HlyD family n=1 Tax=Nitrococcus mobilis Nb-231 TaxID=314278 RepID=A4BRA2_9GAMM|nr:secretion protein, HlyD family [Nitrococcus mobilis Nb-231]